MSHASTAYAIIVLGVLEGIGIPLMYLRPTPRLAQYVSAVTRRFTAVAFLGCGIVFVTLGLILIHGKWDDLFMIGYFIGVPTGLIGSGGIIVLYVRRAMRASREG